MEARNRRKSTFKKDGIKRQADVLLLPLEKRARLTTRAAMPWCAICHLSPETSTPKNSGPPRYFFWKPLKRQFEVHAEYTKLAFLSKFALRPTYSSAEFSSRAIAQRGTFRLYTRMHKQGPLTLPPITKHARLRVPGSELCDKSQHKGNFSRGKPPSLLIVIQPEFHHIINQDGGNRAGRCRWLADFLGDLPFPSPLHSRATPFSPHFTLIGSQDLVISVAYWLFAATVEGDDLACILLYVSHWPRVLQDVSNTAWINGKGNTNEEGERYNLDAVGVSVVESYNMEGRLWSTTRFGLTVASLVSGYEHVWEELRPFAVSPCDITLLKRCWLGKTAQHVASSEDGHQKIANPASRGGKAHMALAGNEELIGALVDAHRREMKGGADNIVVHWLLGRAARQQHAAYKRSGLPLRWKFPLRSRLKSDWLHHSVEERVRVSEEFLAALIEVLRGR
ncbi:hypothetical protein PR048_010038 [Dryococelus australis]|uniref:Uncharacterized protein n=1 Tax=Dryococelus australis TaxID=614101 RepID=A0ABQ9I2K0_9NEOP|nr:hypothetical protein PR048_010038 [Dryococelus australis]